MKLFSTAILVATGVAGLALTGCVHHHHEPETVYVQQPAQPVYVQPAPAYVVVPVPPPPVIVEQRPLPPSRSHVWVQGSWRWDGRQYAWQRGYWAVPPRGYSHWVAPRYEHHGHEYRYRPGYWDHGRH